LAPIVYSVSSSKELKALKLSFIDFTPYVSSSKELKGSSTASSHGSDFAVSSSKELKDETTVLWLQGGVASEFHPQRN